MDEAQRGRACPACGAVTGSPAAYCSQCGMALSSAQAQAKPAVSKWYYNVWFVLFMLFFVVGPFGLPLVWKNPRFSRGIKGFLTLAMVVYTLALVKLTIVTTQAILQHVNEFNATLLR